MDVNSATGTNGAGTSNQKSSATGGTTMGDYNTFLQLLIAQAKNQDPTNPTDPSQYVQQFAALSQVEQTVTTNAKLEEILNGLAAIYTAMPKPESPPADGTPDSTPQS
jgi:flagellar hook assembly protein FlgD